MAKKVVDEMTEEMLDLEAIGTHAGNMSLHEFFAFLVCDRQVALQKAIITRARADFVSGQAQHLNVEAQRQKPRNK